VREVRSPTFAVGNDQLGEQTTYDSRNG
jgi:hypothetical protein